VHAIFLLAVVVTPLLVRSNFLACDSKLILSLCSRLTPTVVCMCMKQDHSIITGFPHDVGSRSPRPLKIGPTGCPETTLRNYHSALRNISEELIFQDHNRIFVFRVLAEAHETYLMFIRDFL